MRFLIILIALFIAVPSFAMDKKLNGKGHQDLECANCHNTATPVTIPANKACLSCHGKMEVLVEKTAKYDLNPHNSPHWGTEVPCATCHRQHQEPQVYCAPCHVKVPYVVK